MKYLRAEQIEQFRQEGYLSPLTAMSPSEALGYRARLEASEREFGALKIGGLGSKSHLLFPWVDELARHPRVLDAIEDLIGEDILIYTLTLWLKGAHDGAFVDWHQDASYFGLEPKEQVTAWIALSTSSEQSGCVRVIPGSHRSGIHRHSIREGVGNHMLPRRQAVDTTIDESSAVRMPLQAGQFSLHHTLAIHGSEPNRSDDRRLGVGISYIPTRCRFTGKTRLTGMLVRGTDRFGHFDHERRPARDCDAIEYHAAVMKNYFGSKKELNLANAE
ncbi:MAG: phytanoyl-CoA dioxygenase family protein [Proteobacteria bacterium]|nr:phytanoyl-CoA dioxygenase family protein [Burkholderiales bacterium]